MDLAVAKLQQNEYNAAHSLYSSSLDLYKKLEDIGFQYIVMRLMGDLEIKRNNLAKGMGAYRESLAIAQAVKSNLQIAYNFWGLARVEKIKKNHPCAVQLYIASKRILEDMGAWASRDDLELDEEFASARAVLGESAFQAVWEAGQRMAVEEAIELVLSDNFTTDFSKIA